MDWGFVRAHAQVIPSNKVRTHRGPQIPEEGIYLRRFLNPN